MESEGQDLRSAILERQDLPENIVEVPAWQTSVLVRGLDGVMQAKVRKIIVGDDSEREKGAKVLDLAPEILQRCLYDPTSRERIFKPGDIDRIQHKNGAVLEGLALEVITLSGMSEKAEKEAKKE